MSRYENLSPQQSCILYARSFYPAAYVLAGSVVQRAQWGFTKAHAAKRVQTAVRKATGADIPIYKSIKHRNEMVAKRK